MTATEITNRLIKLTEKYGDELYSISGDELDKLKTEIADLWDHASSQGKFVERRVAIMLNEHFNRELNNARLV